MRRLVLACLIIAASAAPAAAATGLAFLPQTPGQRIAFRVVRSVQTPAGPQTTTSTFSVVHRAGTTLVIERAGPNGAPNLSVLKANPDGTLALADKTTASDGDLIDLLYALNLAVDATREGDPTASGTWLAVVPTAPAPNATTAPVVLVPGAVAKNAFDFSGTVQTSALPAVPQRRERPSLGGGGFGGAGGPGGGGGAGGSFPGGGGGFPGGGSRRHCGDDTGPPDGDNEPRASGPIALTIHIDGHATNGQASRITITETRVLTLANMPYVNVGSWTITAGP